MSILQKTISDKGVKFIASFEGFLPDAYWDKTGKVWTIGFGHTKGVKKGDHITRKQGYDFLQEDCNKAVSAVNKYAAKKTEWSTPEPRNKKYSFTQTEFDALVSFTFNCGAGNLKILLADGTRSKDVIAQKILQYDKSGGLKLRGLTRRRKAENILFTQGRYTDGY